MKSSLLSLKFLLFCFTILTISHLSPAKETEPTSEIQGLDHLLNQLSQWRKQQLESQQGEKLTLGLNTVIAWVLCFIAASLSSAGGVGGGSLYLPILNLVAGLDLKTAATFSAFMVTGGSVSTVLYNLCFQAQSKIGGKSLIDYEIALLSEPCMLLGVSVGVICNVMFPEWLITMLFAKFLACSTYKTCKAGCKCWKVESEEVRRNGFSGIEGGEEEKGMEKNLLERGGEEDGLGVPWKKLLVWVMVWISFFGLLVLTGDKDEKV